MISLERVFIDPGFALLPENFDSPEARALVIAIGLQESEFKARRQIASYRPTLTYGPARGFWQFEIHGVRQVLQHPSTRVHAITILDTLFLPRDPVVIHREILPYCDSLACAYARLLFWPIPRPLPKMDEPLKAWQYYLDAWRPGSPFPDKWANNFNTAWNIVLS